MDDADPKSFPAPILFRAIGETHRLDIIHCLMRKELTVGEIEERLSIEPTLLSKHLKALLKVGLVRRERDGRHLRYSVNPKVRRRGHPRSIFLHCCEIRLHS